MEGDAGDGVGGGGELRGVIVGVLEREDGLVTFWKLLRCLIYTDKKLAERKDRRRVFRSAIMLEFPQP